MISKRQIVVEPVFGVLTRFMGLRKVYTKGIRNANKQMLMAAAAYNLKKLISMPKHHQRVWRIIKSSASAGQGNKRPPMKCF